MKAVLQEAALGRSGTGAIKLHVDQPLRDEDAIIRLHDDVFSVGNTVDPADGYRAFRGHDAGTGALMRRRGFAPGDATARTRSKP